MKPDDQFYGAVQQEILDKLAEMTDVLGVVFPQKE